jgi:hypothetical protein
MRKFVFLVFMALAACSNNSAPQGIQGEWTINKEVAAAPIAGISDEETAELIGDKLFVRAQSIQFQNHTCDYTLVENNKQTIAEFLQFYSLDASTKLPEGTSVLRMDCEGGMAIKHLLASNDKVWLVWYGVLLEATRI